MRFMDRLNLFIRSLSIQASWNFPRMQGLGFFFSLLPWLRKAAGSGFREACYRHLGYFNTNPYMSPYILGVVARLEEEGKGEESVRARNNLMGPLGAMGDGFYWATLLPVVILVSLAFSFFIAVLAPVFFLIVYNCVHLRNRWAYLERGYRNAHEPLKGAAGLNGQKLSKIFEHLAAPAMGLILGMVAFGTQTPGTAMLLFGLAFCLFRRQWKMPAVFAILVIVAVLLGLLGLEMSIPWSE